MLIISNPIANDQIFTILGLLKLFYQKESEYKIGFAIFILINNLLINLNLKNCTL